MNLVTDGARIHFNELAGGHIVLSQISVAGGETSQIPTPFRNVDIGDISPDRSQLLIGTVEGSQTGGALVWALPLPSGSPHRIGDASATGGAWSPDGTQLVYASGTKIYAAKPDGTEPRVLASIPESRQQFVDHFRFSPDGNRIRFSVNDNSGNTPSIWEIRRDGSGLHAVFPGWHNPPAECCGEWTRDGRYFVFISSDRSGSNVFAVAEQNKILRKISPKPIQLTAGPLFFYQVAPSFDGKKLFVEAIQPRAQVVRHDAMSGQFVPFLSGISATDLAFSPDDQWVAYVTIPDGNLWRSRVDGSERLQLTFSPTMAVLPVWSSDGSRIAYNSFSPSKGWKAQLISSKGGAPEDLLPSGGGGVDFNWLHNGSQIIFSSGPGGQPDNIQVLDLRTHHQKELPGSDGLFSPRISPNGNYVAALSRDSQKLMLYDFRTGKWSQWLTETGNIAFPTWSRDGKYLYFDNFLTDHPTTRRVRLGATLSEELWSIAAINRYFATASGSWGGLAPDGSRLYVQDISAQEIYALDVEFP